MDDDKGPVNDVEVVQNLGGREMLSCMTEGSSVCVVVVLMVVVGVAELMEVVGVVCLGAVEVDCSGVVDLCTLEKVLAYTKKISKLMVTAYTIC